MFLYIYNLFITQMQSSKILYLAEIMYIHYKKSQGFKKILLIYMDFPYDGIFGAKQLSTCDSGKFVHYFIFLKWVCECVFAPYSLQQKNYRL